MPKKPKNKGPIFYENWQEYLKKTPWQLGKEFPLFSDAYIGDEIINEFGPYQIFNTILDISKININIRPCLVLRVDYYIKNVVPDLSKTDDTRYHGGELPDEITALLSLFLGIRLKPGGENRLFTEDNDPRGRPYSFSSAEDPQLSLSPSIFPTIHKNVLPNVLGFHSLQEAKCLSNFPNLSSLDAIALVRSARLYQEAVWISESSPNLSWIMFTSAIESAACHWSDKQYKPVEKLKYSFNELYSLLSQKCDDNFIKQISEVLIPFIGSTKKFVDFLMEYLPSPPEKRPVKFGCIEWKKETLEKIFKKIYKYRSKALHGGTPFPKPMCDVPSRIASKNIPYEKPLGSAYGSQFGTWIEDDMPILLNTFEYIVRETLKSWWKSLL